MGTRRKILSAIKYVGVAMLVPSALHLATMAASSLQTPMTREKAQEFINEERSSLGLLVDVELQVSKEKLPRDLCAVVLKHPLPNRYVVASSDDYLTKAILRHEMAHVAAHQEHVHNGGSTIDETVREIKGVENRGFLEGFYSYFILESQANLYALTGIKTF